MELQGKKVAILAGKLYEDLELWYPYYRLKEEGAEVTLVGAANGPDTVESKHGLPAKVDKKADQVSPDQFDAVIVPGGYSPDHLRRCKRTVEFVAQMSKQGKLVAAICHAGWLLASADVLRGKKGTCFYSIKHDMANAGMQYIDQEVVVDKNLVTSRFPPDLPAFMKQVIKSLAQQAA